MTFELTAPELPLWGNIAVAAAAWYMLMVAWVRFVPHYGVFGPHDGPGGTAMTWALSPVLFPLYLVGNLGYWFGKYVLVPPSRRNG